MKIFIALGILINLSSVTYALDDAEFLNAGEATDSLNVEKRGWVDRRYCSSPRCAALGDPYRYNVYSAGEIKEAALAAIQEIGFSLNPDKKSSSIGECNSLHQQYGHAEGSNFSSFWTDFVILNENFLKTLKITWKEIGIVQNDDITYRLQLMGCHCTIANGADVPFSNPRAARLPESSDADTYRTSVKLIMAVTMEKRASKSAFIPTVEFIQPKAILDRIKQLIELRANEVKIRRFDSDSRGRVRS
jgi:hypothetical protein